MTFKYKRLDKNDVALLMVDHQAGLLTLVRDFSPAEAPLPIAPCLIRIGGAD